jgi:heme o synthase
MAYTKTATGYSSPYAYTRSRVKAYAELTKLRLSLLVVFSAVMAYWLAVSQVAVFHVLMLALGGFLITGASNALNQIIEKDFDKLMIRTAHRPLATGALSVGESLLLAGIFGITGIITLAYYFNILSALLGALALLSYAFIYTPFKRVSPSAVFVGAVPGSMPLLIGWTAATGELGFGGYSLFLLQFFWQIPHFWAIAWLLDEDYKRAGFSLLPYHNKNRQSALQNIPYLALLIGISTLPYFLGYTGIISLFVVVGCGVLYLLQGIKLSSDLSDASAKRLMFASFFYLPVVLLAYVIDKI